MSRIRLALATTVVLLSTSCSSSVPPPNPSSAGQSTPSAQAPGGPTPAGSPPAVATATPSAGDPGVPADIAADVDALLGATTHEAVAAATRTILEKSGVVITDDPTAIAPTPAAIYMSNFELDLLASEARSAASISRLSFSDFAAAFGAIAGLPPNEQVRDDWASLDLSVPTQATASPPPGTPPDVSDGSFQVDARGYPTYLAGFLTSWVNGAEQLHLAAEPEGVFLSNPPLYLQAFAQRQLNPVDLRHPFAPGDLKLGTLQLTVLIAGMRANVAWAKAVLDAGASTTLVVGAAHRSQHPPAPMNSQQQFSDCDQLKHLIDAHAPLSSAIGLGGKQFIKTMIKGFLDGLFGAASDLRSYVGPAFSALGMLFRVAALVLLYEHSTAELRLEPASIHKPTGQSQLAAAIVEAGIPDHEWERAMQERETDFWSTALRTCARFLGLPVTKDLIDLGEGISQWAVQWEITRGLGRHARMHEGELSGTGVVAHRRERPLQRLDDHTGTDTLALDILTEQQADHPGEEHTDVVTICARVVPREPSGGFKSFLSAGFAGASLASTPVSGLFSLASVIAEILTSFYREMSTIDACENMNVSFHVPQPLPWRGKVKVNWESHSYSTFSESGSSGGYSTSSSSTHADVTEEFFIGGQAEPNSPGYVPLSGNSFVHGAMSHHRAGFSHGFTSFCTLDRTNTEEGGGGWSFDGTARGGLDLYPDGRYTIQLHGAPAQSDLIVPSMQTHDTAVVDGICDPSSSTDDLPLYPPNGGLPMPFNDDSIDGQIDPANPGNRLAGSQTTVHDDGSVTVIEWDLTHDGPIQLPGG